MRRLILLRHAKSDRPAGVADHERPLNDRGRRAAPAVGGHIGQEGPRPDLALVSTATRTRETWDAVSAALGAPEARYHHDIYEAPAERILGLIRGAPDSAETVIVVGHNPGLGDLAATLAGEGPRKERTRLATEFPTAAYAVIAFDAAAWSAIAPGQGRLERFVRPRDIDPDLGG
ncbi:MULTISPECIES: histidine phosphatase family protein [unclassified Methylobacterium]|uniref:SixA phosphatase family protein n=1 Tax=unclassified Methylobacterium TaxID=2615210 RepID=UPI0011C202EF|nr:MULTISPECIES: histidine phosphatase family protein [unclassified Methylobacterium]QEE39229.1 histidine phosphatase family protein [Methylobacterium sp. WL1]TXN04497.1 histidine phosphatase family protein [Methylobacterium sp. WL64]TXN56142.1 histidine phosphatase family protein [Methylobacterium sp. WL2]